MMMIGASWVAIDLRTDFRTASAAISHPKKLGDQQVGISVTWFEILSSL